MSTTRALVACSAIALALSVLGTRGQQPAYYRALPDTLRYESTNSYLMWFVQDGDTLGQPITTRTLELHTATESPGGLQLWVRLEDLQGTGFVSEQTYSITNSGRVLAVDGQPVEQVPHARVDLLPRLPELPATLRPGSTWMDTVSTSHDLPYGPTYYTVRRIYRVARAVDTLSTTALLLVGEGELRLRQGGWQDSVRGVFWWQEVEGPVTDSVWFDAGAGRLIRNRTLMDLVGTGGAGTQENSVVMTSGLRSEVLRDLAGPR